MNDEAANALLKTLEEPPAYVVLLLLTDRPDAGAADDRVALPARALRRAGARRARRAGSSARRRARARRAAAARLELGDGERALALAVGDGAALRAHAEAFARAPLHGRTGAERPWLALLELARARGAAARAAARGAARRGARSSCPRKEHKQARDRGRRAGAPRRAPRRDGRARPRAPARRAVVPRPRLRRRRRARARPPLRPRAASSPADAEGRSLAPLRGAAELVDDDARAARAQRLLRPRLRGARLPPRADVPELAGPRSGKSWSGHDFPEDMMNSDSHCSASPSAAPCSRTARRSCSAGSGARPRRRPARPSTRWGSKPGRRNALIAGASEAGGGALLAAGLLDPASARPRRSA